MTLRLPNFFVYRRDETAPSGRACKGVAVLVRRDVVHDTLPLPDFRAIRSIGVRTYVAGRELRVFAAYKAPKSPMAADDLAAIFADATPTLLAGDLNAKHQSWGSRLSNPAGRALLQDALDLDVEVIGPDSPTHIPTNPRHAPDVLDIALHRGLPCPVSIEVLYDLDTQHLPILITLGAGAVSAPPRPRGPKIDWEAYTTALEGLTLPGPLSTAADVEAAARHITAAMHAAKEAASTPSTGSPRRYDELPPALARLRREKRDLRRLWAHTRCPRVKTRLNRAASELAESVKAWRGDCWESHIDTVSGNSADLFRLTRQLTSTPAPIYPLLDSAGRRHFEAQARADILADQLESQFQPHPAATDDATVMHHAEVSRLVADFLAAPPPPLRGDEFISPTETMKAIRRLPKKKAPGRDGIPSAALARLPWRAVVVLTRLYNAALRTHHFPLLWKEGKIIVLPKPGKDRRIAANYRPITLLPHIAKLFERLLLRRVIPHTPLRVEQYGFRSSHSTTLQLTRVLHHLATELNNGRHVFGVFLDIEKAFDRVWHTGLLAKLANSSLPPAYTHLLACFLNDRKFVVSVEGATSSARPISAGVPQGSCLSPRLYAAYTDDIPTLQGRLLEGERDVTLALFADDSAYFASSRKVNLAHGRMQRLLDRLPEWLDRWRVAVNVTKTAAIFVSRQRKPPPTLTLRGQPVAYSKEIIYLGCRIDRALRMAPQVTHVVNRAKAARAMLRPVLSSRLPLRTKCMLYKAYIRSQLTYAAPAWYPLTSRAQRDKLQSQQAISLRMIARAGRYVRNDVIARDFDIESLAEFVAQMARRMYDRADNGPHEHLRDIAPLHARPPEASEIPLPRSILTEADDDNISFPYVISRATGGVRRSARRTTPRRASASSPEPRPQVPTTSTSSPSLAAQQAAGLQPPPPAPRVSTRIVSATRGRH